MDLDPSGTNEPYDPDIASTGVEQLSDLALKVRFVLPCVRVFHSQAGHALYPSRLVRDVANGNVRSA